MNTENPKQLEELDENSCKWPIGHPDEKSFISVEIIFKRFSYCKLHLLYAYQPKGKKKFQKEEVPEFIERKYKLLNFYLQYFLNHYSKYIFLLKTVSSLHI